MHALRRIAVILVFCLSCQGSAQAADFLCHKNAVTYWIKVEYDKAGQALPCSVYRWVLPQQREMLWRATRDAGFCEAKADEVRQKLESYGWLCQEIGPSDEEPEIQVLPGNKPVM